MGAESFFLKTFIWLPLLLFSQLKLPAEEGHDDAEGAVAIIMESFLSSWSRQADLLFLCPFSGWENFPLNQKKTTKKKEKKIFQPLWSHETLWMWGIKCQ